MSMRQPAKVATPEEAVTVLFVQVRVAPEGLARVTEALLLPTVRPPASWTVTTGCAPNTTPPVESEGLVVNASLVAEP